MKIKLAITKKTLQEYINILPISYYLKHRLEVDITDLDYSFFDRNNGQIMISLKQLNCLTYDNEPTKEQIENDIRSMLYHEVSHAILTPVENLVIDKMIFNVFEDERIETLLCNYYYGVNFKQFVKRVNNYNPKHRPTSLYEYFYYLVRFRDGDKELLKEVDKIIFKARLFNCKTTVVFTDKLGNYYSFKTYQANIQKLYMQCKNKFEQEKKFNQLSNKKKESETNQEEKTIIAKKPTQTKVEETLKEQESQVEDNREDKGIESKTSIIRNYKKNRYQNPKNEFEQLCKEMNINGRDLGDEIYEGIHSAISCHIQQGNKEFRETIKPIILRYKGQLKQNGGSRLTYSGRLNPRLTINNDFKWFEKRGGNSINRGEKLQLNLFIDVSASFCANQRATNNILYELDKLEKELPNVFEYNLITMGTSINIKDKKSRRIDCAGTTTMDIAWKKTIDKAQNPNNDNINIVLFDGRCYHQKEKHLFKMFNKSNFIIIAEVENEPAIRQHCKNTRKNIIIRDGSYTSQLSNNIVKVLNFAIR